jgi:hypothetical protein
MASQSQVSVLVAVSLICFRGRSVTPWEGGSLLRSVPRSVEHSYKPCNAKGSAGYGVARCLASSSSRGFGGEPIDAREERVSLRHRGAGGYFRRRRLRTIAFCCSGPGYTIFPQFARTVLGHWPTNQREE